MESAAGVPVEAAVQATMDRMVQGYEQADAELILSTYEPGAAYAAAPGQSAIGSDALRQLFDQLVAAKPDFAFGKTEIIIAGDLALHLSRYDVRIDGPEATQTGLSVAVLRRQPDGEWLMVIDHPAGQTVLAGA